MTFPNWYIFWLEVKYSIGNEVGIFWVQISYWTEWRLLIYVIYFSFLHNLQRIYPSWERILWKQRIDRFHTKYWKCQNLSTSRKKISLQKTILIICLRSTVIKVYMKQTVKCLFYCLCVLSRVQLFETPVDGSLPGSSVHVIFQVRIVEWVAFTYTRGSSQSKDRNCVSCISCIGRWVFLPLCHLGSPFYCRTLWQFPVKLGDAPHLLLLTSVCSLHIAWFYINFQNTSITYSGERNRSKLSWYFGFSWSFP